MVNNKGIFLEDRYEVLGKIGSGGMADVYKGEDHKLKRFVAIKVLKREYREDDNFVKKFKIEAQAAAGLMHPNIVNVYDVGHDRGLNYMIMELVEGITLKDYIEKKGRLSAKEVISVTIQICTGIEVAHKHQIIHRDIKPQNVIISKEGKVKVTDFGIARATTSNTISTNAMGSVHYTSPEQARGGFSDAKSDIYSVGITMYEMITGQVPFDGDSTVSIAIKHLQEEITPPSEYAPDIPHSLEEIILKCTQKGPDRRYQDMNALILDLKRALVDPEGDFVAIAPLVAGGETVMITPDELNRIQENTLYEDDEYEDDEYEDDEYEDDEYEDDEYEDDEYDDGYNTSGSRNHKRGRKDTDVNPRMTKVMKILTIVVAVIIAFILIFIVGKATGLFKFGPNIGTVAESTDQVKVPELVGKTEEEAKALLKKASLGYKVAARQESKKYDVGIIAEQKTKAGTKVKKNTQIQVVVSSKLVGKEITVPDVSGQQEADAQKILNDAGFTSTSEFVYSDEYGQGQVVGTTPAAGSKAAKDAKITMTVSKGSEQATVPNLLGSSEDSAKQALSNAGLSVGNVSSEYNDSEAGTVISQSVSAKKKVSKGTTVSITVSKGKKPEEKASVPSVVGSSEASAKKAITNAGLSYGGATYEFNNEHEAGVVISVKPGEGSSVSPGTTVSVVVSKGIDPALDDQPEE
ncbi:MAG: Stk1 family PASTA domain-containing Ser/Thr kinase [Lachnospiraceae bacterium]